MYIRLSDSRYPVSEAEIRSLFPNTSFPIPFSPPDDYALVFRSPRPAYNAVTEIAREAAPELTEKGHWEQRWEVVALPPEVVAANAEAAAQALQVAVVAAVQQRLDDFAKTRNYDGILSAATYATSTVPKFQAEGQYAVNARDMTWATLYQILGEVQAGTRPVPTGFADIEPDLPVLTWPQ